MTRTRVREALDQRPFVPFLLHLPDGRSVRVKHPEMVIVPPVDRTIYVYDRGIKFVDLLLVSDIEYVSERKRRSA